MKEWNDVGENVASAILFDGNDSRQIDLVGFIARYRQTPSFVAYRWMCGGKPVDLGNNHLPTVNKMMAIAYARKDDRFSSVFELVNKE